MRKIEPFGPAATHNILTLARAYAEHRDFSLRTVGRYFHGTNVIFEQLESGDVSLNLNTYDRMIAKFQAEWPKGLPFPKLRELRRATKRRGGVSRRKRQRQEAAPASGVPDQREPGARPR